MRSWSVRLGSRELTVKAKRVQPAARGGFVPGRLDQVTVVGRSAAEAIATIAAISDRGMPAEPTSVDEITWYHTIELPGGVVTPGFYDHRSIVADYGFPSDMTGMRALDVASFDGFWAFTMEDRGAQVTAIDLGRHNDSDFPPPARELLDREYGDVPTAPGFAFAHRARGSSVHKITQSIYDLSPDDIGTFDFVHCADVLLHLERPWLALRAIHSVTSGTALIVDTYGPHLERGLHGPTMEYRGGWHHVTWWLPSLDALGQMMVDAGFRNVRVHRTYNLGVRDSGQPGPWRAALLADA